MGVGKLCLARLFGNRSCVLGLIFVLLWQLSGCHDGQETQTGDPGNVDALRMLIDRRRFPEALKVYQEQAGSGPSWAYYSGDLFLKLGMFYRELYRFGVSIEHRGYEAYADTSHTPVTQFFHAISRYERGDQEGANEILRKIDRGKLPQAFHSAVDVWTSALSSLSDLKGTDEQILLDWLRYKEDVHSESLPQSYQKGGVFVGGGQTIASRLAPAALGGLYAQAGLVDEALLAVAQLDLGNPLYETPIPLRNDQTGQVEELPFDFYTSFVWRPLGEVYLMNAERAFAEAATGSKKAWQTVMAHYWRGIAVLELGHLQQADREFQVFLELTSPSSVWAENLSVGFYRPLAGSARAAAKLRGGDMADAETLWDDLERAQTGRLAILADRAAWLARTKAEQTDVQKAVEKAKLELVRTQRQYHNLDGFDQAYFFEGAKRFASVLYEADGFCETRAQAALAQHALALLRTVYDVGSNYSPEESKLNRFPFLFRLSYCYYAVNRVSFGQEVLARLYDWDMQWLQKERTAVPGRSSQFYPILKIYQNARKIGSGGYNTQGS